MSSNALLRQAIEYGIRESTYFVLIAYLTLVTVVGLFATAWTPLTLTQTALTIAIIFIPAWLVMVAVGAPIMGTKTGDAPRCYTLNNIALSALIGFGIIALASIVITAAVCIAYALLKAICPALCYAMGCAL
jgi:hypothetical protein